MMNNFYDKLRFDIGNDPFGAYMMQTIDAFIFDKVLASRGDGTQLGFYEDVERDIIAGGALAKRRQAVLARPWHITPASDAPLDVAAADTIRDWFGNDNASANWLEMCETLLSATCYGVYCVELLWRRNGDKTLPAVWRGVHPRRYRAQINGEMRLLTMQQPRHGELVRPENLLVHKHRSGGGEWLYGRGLASELWFPVYFRKNGLIYWLTSAERFGAPSAVADAIGANDAENKAIDTALSKLQSGGHARFPQGANARLLEAAGNTGQIFLSLQKYIDATIMQRVHGESLTTDMGSVGSNAAMQTSNVVRLEPAVYDANMLSRTLRMQVFAHITRMNHPGAMPPMISWQIDDPGTSDKMLERLERARQLGYEPENPEETLTDLLGVQMRAIDDVTPPANDDSAEEDAPQTEDAMVRNGWLARASHFITARLSRNKRVQKKQHAHVENAADDAADAVGEDLLAAVDALLETSTSGKKFDEATEEVADNVNTAQPADKLRNGLVASDLYGRGSAE